MEKKDLSYKFYKFSLLMFLMFIASLNYNLFINPTNTVAGGANGVSIIFQHLLNANPSIIILIINTVALIITTINKEYELALSAMAASIIYPLFIQITSSLNGILLINSNDLLIITVFGGIITGIVSGLTCKNNISQGGIILISQVINKKYKKSTSTINMLINSLIVICGGFIFGVTTILYALVYLYSSKIVTDKILLGISQNKLFQIITNHEQEVIEYITKELEIGVTTFKTQGGINEKKQTVIMTSIVTVDYFKLKEGIYEIDKDAFVVITDSYQVKGGK